MPAITPAQRTIRVTASANGIRMFDYPDGDYAAVPPPAYMQNWDWATVSSDGNDIEAEADLQLGENVANGGFDPTVYPWMRTFVTTPLRENTASLSLTLRVENRRWLQDSNGRCRVELAYARDESAIEHGVDYWIGWSVYLDPAAWPNTSQTNLYMNVAQHPVKLGTGSLVLMQCSSRSGAGTQVQCQFGVFEGVTFATGQSHYYIYGGSGKNMYTGRWYDLVWHVRLSPSDANGRCEIWMTDTVTDVTSKVVDYSGRIGYGDRATAPASGTNSHQWRNGLYGGANPASATYAAFFSTFRTYIGTDGYSIVAPRD